jgi:hypothetical protein
LKKNLVAVLLCLSLPVSAQTWCGLGASGNLGTITYQNSQFEKHENLKGYPGAAISFLYLTRIPGTLPQKAYAPNDLLTTEVGYKSTHIKDESTHLTTWSFNYLTGSIGARHYHKPKEVMNFYFGGGIVADLLLTGTQLNPSGQYDLTRDIRRVNIGVAADVGVHYRVTEDNFCSIGIGYQRGIRSVEKDRNLRAWFHSWRITIAMVVSVKTIRRNSKK